MKFRLQLWCSTALAVCLMLSLPGCGNKTKKKRDPSPSPSPSATGNATASQPLQPITSPTRPSLPIPGGGNGVLALPRAATAEEAVNQERLAALIRGRTWLPLRKAVTGCFTAFSGERVATAFERTGIWQVTGMANYYRPGRVEDIRVIDHAFHWELGGRPSYQVELILTYPDSPDTRPDLPAVYRVKISETVSDKIPPPVFAETYDGKGRLRRYHLAEVSGGKIQRSRHYDGGGDLLVTTAYCYTTEGLLASVRAENLAEHRVTVHDANKASVLGHRLATIPVPAPGTGYLFPDPDQVVISVWDSGVNPNHPDLKNRLAGILPLSDWQWGFDLSADLAGNDRNPYDFYHTGLPPQMGYHGTKVAGACLGQNLDLRVLPLRAAESEDYPRAVELTRAFSGKIVNMSFGFYGLYGYDWNERRLLPQPLPAGDLRNREIMGQYSDLLFVCAAGNDGFDVDAIPHYPSSFPFDNILAVSAAGRFTSDHDLAPWSNRGILNCDVAAPGDKVATIGLENPSEVATGTSFSAPLVCRLAGEILVVCPRLTAAEVRELVIKTCDVDPSHPLPVRSGGVINPGRALQVARALATSSGLTVDEALRAVEGDARSGELKEFWRQRILECWKKGLKLAQPALPDEQIDRLARARAAQAQPENFWHKDLGIDTRAAGTPGILKSLDDPQPCPSGSLVRIGVSLW